MAPAVANHGSSGLWIIPISMVIALGVLMGCRKSVQQRARDARMVIGSGIASVLAWGYYYARMHGAGEKDELGLGAAVTQVTSFEIGAVLSLVASIGLTISGFLHLRAASQSRGRPPER